MKRLRVSLTLSIVALVCVAGLITASGAMAWTKKAAEETANDYAQIHFPGFPYLQGCQESGKNEKGVAQWYCWGNYHNRNKEWHVNVGPYGEITYAHE